MSGEKEQAVTRCLLNASVLVTIGRGADDVERVNADLFTMRRAPLLLSGPDIARALRLVAAAFESQTSPGDRVVVDLGISTPGAVTIAPGDEPNP
ncbi:hypothetical protein [Nocardia sp. NPDC046763]|uniref:hypothetical protein n=1 Tax=Nocardia sp. NPDC046763 TaxID=3155256 RepID=UPI0034085A90